MILSNTVFVEEPEGAAAAAEQGKVIYYEGGGKVYPSANGVNTTYEGDEMPSDDRHGPNVIGLYVNTNREIKVGDRWINTEHGGKVFIYGGDGDWIWDGLPYKKRITSSSSSKKDSLSAEEKRAIEEKRAEEAKEKALAEQAAKESVRLEAEAADEGFTDGAQMQDAKAQNKTAGEYYNNAAVDTPGIENATLVAQGCGLIIDGKVTNMTAGISKASEAYVDSVLASQEGTVLNVVDVQFPATEATINFYMPGVVDGANIAAVQYVDGEWVDVEVAEVRVDHVTLNLKGSGIVAFLAK